jgi:peptidoglycan/xylan/chitin deacetylase (PgdA/CDA1 family)
MVTRTPLPQDYIVDEIVLEDFSDTANYSGYGDVTNLIIENDTEHVVSGTSSLKITSQTPATNKRVIKTTNLQTTDFLGKSIYGLRVYIPQNAIPSSITVFTGSGGVTKNFYYNVGSLKPGWNILVFSQADMVNTGSDAWNLPRNMIMIRVYNQTGLNATVTCDALLWRKRTIRSLRINFDDGIDSVYTQAYPVMASKGFKGTVYVNPATIDTAGHMTLAQLHELHNQGWCISNHTYNHAKLSELTYAEQYNEIKSAQDWLIENGFLSGAYLLAFPWGLYNDDTLAICDELNIEYARTVSSKPDVTPLYGTLRLHAYSVTNTTTVTQAIAFVTECKKIEGSCNLLFHYIVASPSTSTEYSIANFTTLINTLSAMKETVRTDYEYIRGLINPRYRAGFVRTAR